MHKKYIIEGDLTRYAAIVGNKHRQRIWDAIAEFKMRSTIDLLNQHNGSAKFHGPIGIIGTFYLLYPKDVNIHKRVDHAIHTRKPTMSTLIYFLEHIGFGILFGNTASIASIACNKVYTLNDARVEIEIFSMKKP
jgi:hypothetical protein